MVRLMALARIRIRGESANLTGAVVWRPGCAKTGKRVLEPCNMTSRLLNSSWICCAQHYTAMPIATI